jgi:DNA (cytosine-5)-methyltransferase 1
MKFASVCSGIEAASMAWHDFGWEPVWFSQFDPDHDYAKGPDFASAVLQHHYPDVPNIGDMTKIYSNGIFNETDFGLLVGGTPCQSFSIAGLRKGLSDPRGNLALEYVRLLDLKKPRWFIWENVTGVLSSNGGRDFASIIAAFTKVGYGVSWRVLDSRYFGVPQKRRRIFVVGYLGDWRRSAAVLFEPESLSRHFGKGKEKRESTSGNSGTISAFDMRGFGDYGDGRTSSTLKRRDYKDNTDLVVQAAYGYSKSHRDNGNVDIRFTEDGNANTLNTGDGCGNQSTMNLVANRKKVRRLTPIECERLQGFPELENSLSIEVVWNYSDLQNNCASAGDQNLKSQEYVYNVEQGQLPITALCVENHINTSQEEKEKPVVESVHINLERMSLQYLNQERSSSSVSVAKEVSGFPLLTLVGDIAPTIAHIQTELERRVQTGREELLPKLTPSIALRNGRISVILSGQETEEIAKDVIKLMNTVKGCLKFTTPIQDQNSQSLVETLKNLSYYVVAVMSMSILQKTEKESFCINLTISRGFTNIPWKGKNFSPSSLRYMTLGNSMAVPCMRWIGERIKIVDTLPDTFLEYPKEYALEVL